MTPGRRKTILLSIQYWRAVTSILRTGIFSSLKNEGFRIVVVSPYCGNKDFVEEFGGENISFENLKSSQDNNLSGLIREGLSLFIGVVASFVPSAHRSFIKDFIDIKWFYKASLGAYDKKLGSNKLLKLAGRCSLFAVKIFTVLSAAIVGALLAPFVKAGILKAQSLSSLHDRINCLLIFRETRGYIEPLFARYNPDLVCVSRMHYCYPENLLVTMARDKGIPSIGIYSHLDGLFARMPLDPVNMVPYIDRLLVWSETVKEEVASSYHFKKDIISVTGHSGHDIYFDFLTRKERLSREEFFEKMGFDKAKKLLLLAPPVLPLSTPYALAYRGIVKYIIDSVLQDKFIYPCQLFIRLHPADTLKTYYYFMKEFGNKEDIFITLAEGISRSSRRDRSRNDFWRFAEMISHSDVLIAGRSGVAIDAAIFDTPTVPMITVNISDVFEKYMFPGVRLFDPERFIISVNSCLSDHSLGREERKRIARGLCGEIDGNACRRITQEIKNMCCSEASGS